MSGNTQFRRALSVKIKDLARRDTMIESLAATWYEYAWMALTIRGQALIPIKPVAPLVPKIREFASPDNKKAPGIRGLDG
jgi:hypothetical protein